MAPAFDHKQLLEAASVIAATRLNGELIAPSTNVSLQIEKSVTLARLILQEIEWRECAPKAKRPRR